MKPLIYKILNENGITIPFPQCDVHIIDERIITEERKITE